jgi:hypothetical protein
MSAEKASTREAVLAVSEYLHAIKDLLSLIASYISSEPQKEFEESCRDGNHEDARWLCEAFRIARETMPKAIPDAFSLTCANGHTPIAQWLHNKYVITQKEAQMGNNYPFRNACHNGHVTTARWLHETFQYTKGELTLTRAQTADSQLRSWLDAEIAQTQANQK